MEVQKVKTGDASIAQKFKNVNIVDIFHIILFIFAIIPAIIFKKTHPKFWLICEYKNEARDNGFFLYKYICENHPEVNIVYALNRKSEDYEKVQKLGKVISYGSFIHWIYYLAAEVNISSQKGGKPNAAVCYVLEVFGILKNKRVFLQHGITKDAAPMFFYNKTKMRLFICGAEPEFNYVKENFGYPKENVVYSGFSRFDNLFNLDKPKKQILLAPTWRRWLYTNSSNPYDNKCVAARDSLYFRTFKSLLENSVLSKILEEYNYELVFFPHRNMTSIFEENVHPDKNIKILNWHQADLQVLMKESACMITDYSSVAMDFAYMLKPLIYFQFDFEEYRNRHFEEGYFDYETDGFGPVVKNEVKLLSVLCELLENNCKLKPIYEDRIKNFFPLHDNKNSERIFNEIMRIL